MEALESRFDWYEMTFESFDDGRERSALALALGGELARSKGRNGYAECWAINRGDSTLALVYGHSARLGEVHIVTTGESCDEVVPVLRRMWPEHRISRADSSVDFEADFEKLDAVAVAFAESRSLSFRLVTNSDGGATRYLGAPSSELRVRVYKKSEQLRALHPERADEVPDGIVRVELQARPGKRDIKAAVATMTADDLWGLGAWSQVFAAEMLGFEAERVPTHFRRPSDWSRALHYLGKQYAPMVERRAGEVGNDRVRVEVLAALGLS